MFRKIIFFLVSSLIVFGLTIYFRLGAHRKVKMLEKSIAEKFLIYKEHQGPYHKINDVIVEVEKIAADFSLPCTKTFGEYLDDPRKVDERQLRSRAGCVIEQRLTELPAGLHQRQFPGGKFLVAIFDGAPSIGPMKVYPKVHNWFHEKKLPEPTEVLEIYSITDTKTVVTEYLFRIK